MAEDINVKKLRMVVLCLAASLLNITSARAQQLSGPQVFVYSSWSTGYSAYIDIADEAVYFHDAGVSATFCVDGSGFIGVDSPFFHFAIPTNFASERPREWTVQGHTYAVVEGPHRLKAFARSLTITTIESSYSYGMRKEQIRESIRYYYSREFGLIAFEMGGRERWTLNGESGFGALQQ